MEQLFDAMVLQVSITISCKEREMFTTRKFNFVNRGNSIQMVKDILMPFFEFELPDSFVQFTFKYLPSKVNAMGDVVE